jgi:hypothetical protein
MRQLQTRRLLTRINSGNETVRRTQSEREDWIGSRNCLDSDPEPSANWEMSHSRTLPEQLYSWSCPLSNDFGSP